MLTITKAKIKGNGLFVAGKRQDGGGPSGISQETFDTPIHANLQGAMDALRIHQGVINGFLTIKKGEISSIKPEMLDDLKVSGFSISTKGDAVIITGMIRTPSGKWTTYNTPLTAFDGEENRYKYMDDLIEKLDAAKVRIQKYLSGEEVGEAKQIALDMPEVQETE